MTTDGALASAVQNTGLRGAIAVGDVTGGEPTSPMWASKVGNAEFKAALVASMKQNGLLSAPGAPGRYTLQTNLLALAQPLAGFDMTVKASVKYTLTDTQTGKKVFDEFVSTSHTATMGDTVIGVQRLRLANQGAIKKNIKALIDLLVQKWPEIRAKSAAKSS